MNDEIEGEVLIESEREFHRELADRGSKVGETGRSPAEGDEEIRKVIVTGLYSLVHT